MTALLVVLIAGLMKQLFWKIKSPLQKSIQLEAIW